MTLWLIIAGMAVGTYLLRASFLLLPDRFALPAPVQQALQFVPAAVLTAMWAPELLFQKGVPEFALGNERLLGGLVAIAVAWRFRLTFATIFAGLLAVHVFDRIF
jgi:branched-subunit amino acid transport protein